MRNPGNEWNSRNIVISGAFQKGKIIRFACNKQGDHIPGGIQPIASIDSFMIHTWKYSTAMRKSTEEIVPILNQNNQRQQRVGRMDGNVMGQWMLIPF